MFLIKRQPHSVMQYPCGGSPRHAVYLFDSTTGQQIDTLVPDDGGAPTVYFGYSVSTSGPIVVIGAPNDDDNGEDSGSAYLFDTTLGQQIAKVLPDDGAAEDQFGSRLSIHGGTAIVGAFADDDNGDRSGSAYVFDVSSCLGSKSVIADSFLVTRGSYVSGGAVELAESDNADLSLQRNTSDTQSRTEFEVKTVSPVANPSSMDVTLEGSVFARTQVNQTIELFAYVGGVWEPVDTRTAARFSDSTVTATATGDLSRFVEAGTMCIKARIRYQSVNPRQRFSSNTDQFLWTIGQ